MQHYTALVLHQNALILSHPDYHRRLWTSTRSARPHTFIKAKVVSARGLSSATRELRETTAGGEFHPALRIKIDCIRLKPLLDPNLLVRKLSIIEGEMFRNMLCLYSLSYLMGP